jgi:hypothetical protein
MRAAPHLSFLPVNKNIGMDFSDQATFGRVSGKTSLYFDSGFLSVRGSACFRAVGRGGHWHADNQIHGPKKCLKC